MRVTVPGSSANLGPGFDALGMAVTVYALVGLGGEPPEGTRWADEHHPATKAFRLGGGTGRLWAGGRIPMGRGLGYSGAVRIGGLVAAHVQRAGPAVLDDRATRWAILERATELEGHADNAAASLLGGVVATAGGRVVRVPLAVEPAVVVWVPPSTTGTDASRGGLAQHVPLADAAFNVGRAALMIAALAAGEIDALRVATEDRLHQAQRFQAARPSAEALAAMLDAGAWAAWLSGSGPTVAGWCDPADAERIASSLPTGGSPSVLAIDTRGAVIDTD